MVLYSAIHPWENRWEPGKPFRSTTAFSRATAEHPHHHSRTGTILLRSAGTAKWPAHKELQKSPFASWYGQHLLQECHQLPFKILKLKWVLCCLPAEHTSPILLPPLSLLFSRCHKGLLNQEKHTETWTPAGVCRPLQLEASKISPTQGEPRRMWVSASHPTQKWAASHSGIPPPYTRVSNKANSQSYFKNDSNDVN